MTWVCSGVEADTGERLFTYYPGGAPFPLLRNERWWKQELDPLSKGRMFDFSRPFFPQFVALRDFIPHPSLNLVATEDSEYCNNSSNSKGCYMAFGANHCRDCIYVEVAANCVDLVDCLQCISSELCYDCTRCAECYNVQGSMGCFQCRDSYFLHVCRGCRNCFGCVHLRQAEYCIFNEQKTPAEYRAFLASIDLSSYSCRKAYRLRFEDLVRSSPQPHVFVRKADECTGNVIAEARHVYDSFFVRDAEDCRYCFALQLGVKDCMDFSYFGESVELVYDSCVIGLNSSRLAFCFNCWTGAHQLLYCELCPGSQNCFGCVGLHRQEYCILNKQYSKKDYFAEVQKIVAHMERSGEWGEFFPMTSSAQPYNVTVAQRFFPCTEAQARAEGLRWFEDRTLDDSSALAAASLPDGLPESDASITVRSEKSGKLFRITAGEIAKYRKLSAPLPRRSFTERMDDKARWLGGLQPYTRRSSVSGKEVHTYFSPELYPTVIAHEEYEAMFGA